MSDIFHDEIPAEFIATVARVMTVAAWHNYQVLTKRPERMLHLLGGALHDAAKQPHIWWGVTVENRRHGIPRIEILRSAPARVRFLSIEPLLEDLGDIDLHGIDWVIVGGESGRRPRPLHPEWAGRLRDRCAEMKIPFFFKQWGGTRKQVAGRLLDGRTYDEMPITKVLPIPPLAVRRALETAITE